MSYLQTMGEAPSEAYRKAYETYKRHKASIKKGAYNAEGLEALYQMVLAPTLLNPGLDFTQSANKKRLKQAQEAAISYAKYILPADRRTIYDRVRAAGGFQLVLAAVAKKYPAVGDKPNYTIREPGAARPAVSVAVAAPGTSFGPRTVRPGAIVRDNRGAASSSPPPTDAPQYASPGAQGPSVDAEAAFRPQDIAARAPLVVREVPGGGTPVMLYAAIGAGALGLLWFLNRKKA